MSVERPLYVIEGGLQLLRACPLRRQPSLDVLLLDADHASVVSGCGQLRGRLVGDCCKGQLLPHRRWRSKASRTGMRRSAGAIQWVVIGTDLSDSGDPLLERESRVVQFCRATRSTKSSQSGSLVAPSVGASRAARGSAGRSANTSPPTAANSTSRTPSNDSVTNSAPRQLSGNAKCLRLFGPFARHERRRGRSSSQVEVAFAR